MRPFYLSDYEIKIIQELRVLPSAQISYIALIIFGLANKIKAVMNSTVSTIALVKMKKKA